METLIIEETNSVLDVRMNRPEKHNALSQQMISELTEVFNSASKKDVCGILLTGLGKSFCAGADLEYMKSMVNFNFSENQKDSEQLFEMFASMKNCPVPIVAKVHGNVMGGALGLLSVCDAVAALSDTKFAFSEVHLGLVPAVISPFVTARMLPTFARELMSSGKIFTADRALQSGLVTFVGRELEVDSFVKKTLESYIRAERSAVQSTKELLNFLEEGHSSESVKDTVTNLIAKLRVSEAGQKRLKNFLEKRAAEDE